MEYGVHINDISYLFVCLEEKGSNSVCKNEMMDYYVCKEGNNELCNKLSNEIINEFGKDSIQCQSFVNEIKFEEDVKIYVSGNEEPFLADYLVLTVPLNIMKEIKITSKYVDGNKNLKIADFDQCKYGVNVKYLIETKSQFWAESNIINLKYVWDTNHSQRKQSDLKGMLTIQTYPFGKPEKLIQNIDDTIQKFLNVSEFREKENSFEVINWSAKKFIGGNNFVPNINFITSNLGLSLMNSTCDFDKRLIFAGEHTSFGFNGFMEGAILSGTRAAKVIDKRNE
jgi:monoamine oxidase